MFCHKHKGDADIKNSVFSVKKMTRLMPLF